MNEDIYSRMYGARPSQAKTQPSGPGVDKRATRVLGGMKAQNSHVKTVDIGGGELVTFPRAEYVKVLEDQIKQMRVTVRELQNNSQRLTRELSKVYDMMNRMQQDLNNKVDLR
jgi:TolA-binding protein